MTAAPTLPVQHRPSTLSPAMQARKQLLTLFPDGFGRGEWLELRCLDCSVKPARRGPRHYFRSVTALVDAAMKYRGQWDVFFGVAFRRCPTELDMARCQHEKRGDDHVSRLTTAWGDFDVVSDDEPKKPYRSRDELLGQLISFSPAPDLLVGSGAGVHAYWLLGEATPDVRRVADINRGIRQKLRADNAIDAARILRVAGTYNHKHGRPLPVELLEVME